jgi:hypothetical protein
MAVTFKRHSGGTEEEGSGRRNYGPMTCAKPWSKQMWEKIIEAYQALPEGTRTARHVSNQLNSRGDSISPSRVRAVLQATVLEEIIEDAIRTTARTLKMLLDVSDDFPAEPESSEQKFAAHLVSTLSAMNPSVYKDLESLEDTLSRLLANYLLDRSMAAQLAYIIERNEENAGGDADGIPW